MCETLQASFSSFSLQRATSYLLYTLMQTLSTSIPLQIRQVLFGTSGLNWAQYLRSTSEYKQAGRFQFELSVELHIRPNELLHICRVKRTTTCLSNTFTMSASCVLIGWAPPRMLSATFYPQPPGFSLLSQIFTQSSTTKVIDLRRRPIVT
jgi:hypothetical protein